MSCGKVDTRRLVKLGKFGSQMLILVGKVSVADAVAPLSKVVK
jgi:hypothetical protein